MGQTETEEISHIEINNLAKQVFSKFSCDADNANALAKTVSTLREVIVSWPFQSARVRCFS